VTHEEPAGAVWRRLYPARHPDPLGLGRSSGRFGDPTGTRFRVLYLAASVTAAFHEVVLRDRGDGRNGAVPIPMAEIAALACAEIVVASPLTLVDLTGDGRLKMGVPSDVTGARDQAPSHLWSAALHAHPAAPDGVLYPSRLNGERCIALYDRAIGKLTVRASPRLVELRDVLARIIEEFDLAIV
jgi:hypothetical protein